MVKTNLETEAVPLPASLASAIRAADADWPGTAPKLPRARLKLERWGSLLLRDADATVRFADFLPRIDLAAEDRVQSRIFDAAEAQCGQVLEARLGRRLLAAPRVHFFGRSTVVGTGPSSVGFQLLDWSIHHPARAPLVFVGHLKGFDNVLGATNVRLTHAFGLAHVYVPALRAELPDVAILEAPQRPGRARLLLRWSGEPALERRWLARVVQAVSFVLGVPTHVPYFVGYDGRGRRVAACGSSFGVRRKFGSLPGQPVPSAGGAWPVPFLRRLLALLWDRPDAPELDLALDYYLDSYDDLPDAAYLKLVVVLEGLAQRVLRERGAEVGVVHRRDRFSVVRDAQWWRGFANALAQTDEYRRWRAFVENQRETLAAELLPVSRGGKDWMNGLIERLAPKDFARADELGAGQRVLAALLALGTNPDERMRRECRDWHVARHTGVPPGDRAEVFSRLELLRSMLVLMIARWAGYTGPLLGHLRDRLPDGRPGGIPNLSTAISGVEIDDEQRREARARYTDRG